MTKVQQSGAAASSSPLSAKKNTTRVQMELPASAMERLKELRDKTEAASYAEVTKNAYRLYDRLVDMAINGDTLIVQSKDGQQKEIQIFV